MSQFYSRMFYHVIFRTHRRRHCIRAGNEELLHHTLREYLERRGARYVVINGVEDHVHMLVAIGIEHEVKSVMRAAKRASASVVRKDNPDFAWGRGFAIFTVSPYDYKGLIRYITRQKSHHKSGMVERRHEW